MAIIDGIPGLEATVEIDGVAAKEYDPPDDERCPETPEQDYFMLSTYQSRASRQTRREHDANSRPHVIKYIEAKPDAPLNFCLKRSPNFERAEDASGIYWIVQVDGSKGISYDYDDGPLYLTYQKRRFEICVRNDDSSRNWNRLRFGHLRTDDGDNYTSEELKAHAEKAQQLGSLKVLCFHLKAVEAFVDTASSSNARNREGSQVLTVPEKALKGRSLDCATSLESTFTPVRFTKTCINLDPNHRPFAVFEFRYRSMEGLIKEGIVPRPRSKTPSKSPSPTDKTRDGTETGNGQRPARGSVKDKVIDMTKSPVKRERSPFDNDELEIISPRTGRVYKSRRLDDGLLEIDLTEED